MSATRQRELVATAWQIFDEVEAPRPPAGLVGRWARELFGGDGVFLLRALNELALRGHLDRGTAYACVALRSLAREGRDALSPRLGERSPSGGFVYGSHGWEPLVGARNVRGDEVFLGDDAGGWVPIASLERVGRAVPPPPSAPEELRGSLLSFPTSRTGAA